jgi:ABC-type taurine transport system substrate-binding protein
LFRARLDQIIGMNHALVKLARAIDWRFFESGSEPSTRTALASRRLQRG